MFLLLLVMVLLPLVEGEETQKFMYETIDNTVIEPNKTLSLILELTTGSSEYLGSSIIQTTLNITRSSLSPVPYSIVYFNYELTEGRLCYQEWVEVGHILKQYPCDEIVDGWFDTLPPCGRYTQCSSEAINLTITLTEQLFKENYLLIQNFDSDEPVILQTELQLQLSSDNSWFYWGVGLTCLLLISLVILSGIVFYWALKLKRVKKMFQQFKLTEQNINSKQD